MKPIQTAICSFGMSGQVFHAPFLDINPGFDLSLVLERSKNLAAAQYPQIKTVRSFEEIIADENIELVVVNTPNATHFEYTKKALEAGKNVVVEKPFVNVIEEGEELIRIAAGANKMLSVYHNRRWDSDFGIVQSVVKDRLLGDIVEAEIHFDRFKEELSPKQHKEIPGPGTGVLYDLGSHLIDQAVLLFGYPKAVFADIRIVRPVSKVDDYFELLLYYPSVRVRIKASYLVREPIPSFTLFGSKGAFHKSRADVQEADLMAGKKPSETNWGIEPASEKGLLHTELNGDIKKIHLDSPAGNYGTYYEKVYECIRNGAQPPVDPADALNVIRIIEAAFKSNEEKRVIDL